MDVGTEISSPTPNVNRPTKTLNAIMSTQATEKYANTEPKFLNDFFTE